MFDVPDTTPVVMCETDINKTALKKQKMTALEEAQVVITFR